MPENVKEKNIAEEELKEIAEETDESSWSKDQKKRSYYYDDACGYEIYDADEEDEEM